MLDINEKDDVSREIDEMNRARSETAAPKKNPFFRIESNGVTYGDDFGDVPEELSDLSTLRNMDDVYKRINDVKQYQQTQTSQSEQTAGSKAGGVIFVIFFIICVLGIIVSSQFNPAMSVTFMGLIFTVVGIYAVVSNIKNGETSALGIIFIFPIAGIAMTVISSVVIWGPPHMKDTLMEHVPHLALCGFLLVGFLIMLTGIATNIKRKTIAYAEITAICSDVKSRLSRRGSSGHRHTVRTFCPVYTFYFNGQEYTLSDSVYSSNCTVQPGDECTLHVNPSNPKDFYSELSGSTAGMIVGGALFMAIPLIMLILLML